jgi:hypothetical protein
MAVVKRTSETRIREAAKQTIRYIMHRREYGEKITRPLFSWETGDTKKLTAYEAIDRSPKGSRFLRVAISPDPKREDTNRDLNLRELTRETMKTLAKKYSGWAVTFFASIHEGHTDKRHINLLVIVPPGRLTKKEWKEMREAATVNAKKQRVALDQEQGIRTEQQGYFQHRRILGNSGALKRDIFAIRSNPKPAPPQCPVCRGDLDHHGRLLECTNCELSFSGGKYLGLQIEPGALNMRQEVGRA